METPIINIYNIACTVRESNSLLFAIHKTAIANDTAN